MNPSPGPARAPGATSTPDAEYQHRLQRRRMTLRAAEAQEARIVRARGATAVAAAVVAILSVGARLLPTAWILLPAAVFLALVIRHDLVLRGIRHARRAVRFYQRGIARIEDRWAGEGETGERFLHETEDADAVRMVRDPAGAARPPGPSVPAAHHPYAADLDLFGVGSLFQLLSSARTRAGENTLAAWLGTPAAAAVIRERQQAVAELRGEVDLREELALLGEEVMAGVRPRALAAWGAAPPVDVAFALAAFRNASPALARRMPWILGALAAASTATLLVWLAETLGLRPATWGIAPFLVSFGLQGLVAAGLRAPVGAIVKAIDRPARDLDLLARVLERLERERFTSPLLARLRDDLDVDGEPASRRVRELQRRVDSLDSRRNTFFAPIALLLAWGTQWALAIERWRRAHGDRLPRWLAALGELEALVSLAGYAYEHPQDPFPEIVDAGEDAASGTAEDQDAKAPPVFDGRALGHPLLPAARCVRNDLRLGGEAPLLIVSGSNMSGKSTFLRTVGVNAVLAYAGAPVRAARLRLGIFAVGAVIHVRDSLQDGTSRFYAEINRLHELVERAAGQPPLLFLLDEILHGTNSHDRRIGAEAVARALVERGAVGLVTTHDLALAELEESMAPRAANVHFSDEIREGRMVFDYRLRPGVVRKSNALDLMRSIGLDV